MDLYKRYVDVLVIQKKNGTMIPVYVFWDNGKKYKIDKVISKERRVSKTGGCGIRYACLIHGNRRNLFYEKDKWFIESYQP